MSDKQVLLADDHLAVMSPYDASEVAAIKKVAGARWDRLAKVWRVPVTSLPEVLEYAAAWNYHVDPEVKVLELPQHPGGKEGVEEDSNLLLIRFAYDPVKITSVKQIAGVVWDTDRKGWRAPMSSLGEVVLWAEEFGLPVEGNLIALRDEVVTARNQAIARSRSLDADIEVPGLVGELLGYQRAGVAYATEKKKCFIADGMGLGKTLEALASIEWSAARGNPAFPALVVCPPLLLLNWKAEIEKFFPHRTVNMVKDRKAWPETQADYLLIGYSNIHHWKSQLIDFHSYVFDESQYVKNPEAQRSRAAVQIAKTCVEGGLVLCLTGTPITNRPAEYANQLNLIGKLKEFGGKWGFYKRYCNAFRDRFGHWHFEGSSNLEELNDRLRATCYIRRTKPEVMPELPPIRHAEWLIDPDAKVMRDYRKAEENIVEFVANRAAEIAEELGQSPRSAAVRARFRAEASEHLVRLAVLKRLAAMAKLPAVVEWVETAIEDGEKVVVAAHHRDVVDALAAKFGGLKIQGGMSPEAVERVKAKFQTGTLEEAPVIVLSIQAAKTGHTLTAAQNVLFVELPWSPADVDQVASRCHRIGQTGSVQATYALAADTIDEAIFALIGRKRGVVDAATEGDASVKSVSVSELFDRFF